MNDKVDVLTALDNALQRAVERGAAKGSPSYRELREARTAVAELIEAASDHVNGGVIGAIARKERLLAAIARIKGE